jgi:prepilin-type processing-associated H-X9-DG protein
MRIMSDSEWVKRLPRFGGMQTGAFALGDLLAVIAMLSLLTAIFFPKLYRAKLIVQAGACLSDLHQIQSGWILYNNENNGNFPYNVASLTCTNLNWAANFENYSGVPTDPNASILVNPQYSQLAPYVRNAAVYHCPADESRSESLTGSPRVRSYSMSAAIGPNASGTAQGQGPWLGSLTDSGSVNVPNSYTVYLNNGMMRGRLQPSDLIVLVDEHPDSINDGSWAFNMPSSPAQTYWIDYPTSLHGNAGSFSFADGHAVIHPWQAPKAIPPVTYGHQAGGVANAVPGDSDVIWTASHISTIYPP